MKRADKNTPPTTAVRSRLRQIYVPAANEGSSALQHEVLGWVVLVMPSVAIAGGYWILVAAGAVAWARDRPAINEALLALVADMTKELGLALYDHNAQETSVVYAEPCWIWLLRDPWDVFCLMSVDQNQRMAAWSALPSLDPAIAAGTCQALLQLFPLEAALALLALEGQPWGMPPDESAHAQSTLGASTYLPK